MSETREARLRAQEMLRLAADLISTACPDSTVFYDDAECDGACLAADCRAAADDLDEATPEPPTPEPERRVGCEGEDGLLRVHAEVDSCDVCAEPERPAERPVWAVMYTDGITHTDICSLWTTQELAEAARVEAGPEAVGDGSGYYVESVPVGGERPAARCVWRKVAYRHVAPSCPEGSTDGATAFHVTEAQHFRVCPYCGKPLSIEE